MAATNNRVSTVTIHNGISTSHTISDLFRVNCRIIRPGHRYYPMGIQILKLDINPEFVAGFNDSRLTYMADCLDSHDLGYSVFLAAEFASELNQILRQVSLLTGDQAADLKKEYLGLFPLAANDRGLFTVSIDLVAGGLDDYGAPIVKNKFFITCRSLDETCRPANVYSVVWEFSP